MKTFVRNSLFALLSSTLILVSACGGSQDQSTENGSNITKSEGSLEEHAQKGLKPGDIAPAFTLKNIDGNMVSLSDYSQEKGVIVIFTCNHCPYAKAYEDRIIALDKKYRPLGFPVVAINPNDPEIQPEDCYEKMIERAKEKGFTYPYLIDEKQEVYPAYGAVKTPHVFLLQKENDQFVVRYIGAIDDNYEKPEEVKQKFVEMAVDALIAGKPVNPETTVAIGCSIKDKRTQQ